MDAALRIPHSHLDIRGIKTIEYHNQPVNPNTKVKADVVGSDKDVEAFAAAGTLQTTTKFHIGKHVRGKISTMSSPMKIRRYKDYIEYQVITKDRGEISACIQDTEGYLDDLRSKTENGTSDQVLYTKNPFFECFRPLHEIFDFLDVLVEQNPEFISKFENVSVTYEGRAIPAFKISTTSEEVTTPKKTLYTQALIHAREWQAGAATLYTMASMLDDLRLGDKATMNLFDKFDWYFVPIVNIDGYQYTWKVDRMWRTSRHLVQRNGQDVGVDLNRNWPPEEYFNLDSSEVDQETYPVESWICIRLVVKCSVHLAINQFNLTVPALTIEVEGNDFISPQSSIRPVGENINLGLRQFAQEALAYSKFIAEL
ncbi:unnamed protein product [Peronospora belbahrii]|uniref:Peptidase M14 domain-containing protein n=1 Tax=Peronospora belbahrii TaxID=622444 RepID=A0AAU9LE71_9STRA|nr:unnamed protein product [Peronospora belbahrii]